MTVEEYLRAKLGGFPIDDNVLEMAILSAVEVGLMPISLTDDVESILADEEKTKSLKYSLSTLYYSASGYFTGMKQSEQVGDVRVSVSSFNISYASINRWRELADRLREELGFETDPEVTTSNAEMFDASYLRLPSARCRCRKR